ncbi:MAG: hypothetical protein RJA20_967 [Bacteroidota bacterium]
MPIIKTIRNTLFLLVCSVPAAFAQQHLEIPSDPYLPPASPENPAVSPAYNYSGANIWTVQVNVNASGQNILNDAANEPSIAISPVEPNKMMIGWRQFDNIESSFRQAGYAYSTDGGMHWTFPGSINPGVFRSDPVLATDAEGRFYYNSLTLINNNEFSCNVYRSTGLGTWDNGPYAIGGDKQWMVIDQTDGPGKGNIYEHWTSYYSACPDNNFTRSTDEGDSYENCVRISPEVYWGTCAIAPDGTLFVSGADGSFARSSNAENENETTEWEPTAIPVNIGGYIPGQWQNQDPNPAGLKGQNWIAVNYAPGPLFGQIYQVQSVVLPDNSDPAEVMFIRSDDNGETWSTPVRINDDNGAPAWQWMATMSVAPNGRIDVVWLDTRDNPGTVLSSLYYSYSTDGGETWSPSQRMSQSFDPHIGWPQQQKMGDYFHMISDNGGANLTWAGTFTGGQDVYFSRITVAQSSVEQDNRAVSIQSVTPNPFSDEAILRYYLTSGARVQAQVYDRTGRVVRLLSDQQQESGPQQLRWDGRDEDGRRLAAGVYFCRISTDGQRATPVRIILGPAE